MTDAYLEPDLSAVEINRVFHDHECEYYDERFAIVHDRRSARRSLAEVESLLGAPIEPGARVVDVACGAGRYPPGPAESRPDRPGGGPGSGTGGRGAIRRG